MNEEVDEIRRRKLAELEEGQKAQEDAVKQQMMLQQLRKGAQLFLTSEAQNRLDNLRYVRPDKAAQAELVIVKMAQGKQITREKPLTDSQLLTILRGLEPKRETTITRR